MKLKKSPLILRDYLVLDFQYTFHQPEEQFNREEIFDIYQIDFDFMTRKEQDGAIMLFTKIGINSSDEPQVGYSILVESITILDINATFGLSDKESKDLIYYSGLGIAINNLRHFISNMTTFGPLGKYILPSIDINAIHEEKMNEIKNLKKKKAK